MTNALVIDRYLAEERAAIEAVLADEAAGLWAQSGPVAQAIRYSLDAGGKRLRPILCVAAYRASRGAAGERGIRRLACALELIHTYSLVHDDLPCMDDDALRRGRPTAHRVFGSAVAAVAGSAMIPAAFLVLDRGARDLGCDASTRAALARTLGRAAGAGGMVGGQVMDLAAERSRPDLDTLASIHRRKTGALFGGAGRIGAIAAGAMEETVAAVEAYGAQVGLAFQVADDILDETGVSDVLGKDAGRDRALDKATFPALIGLEGAKQMARHAVADAIAALHQAGIRDATLEALARFAVERDR